MQNVENKKKNGFTQNVKVKSFTGNFGINSANLAHAVPSSSLSLLLNFSSTLLQICDTMAFPHPALSFLFATFLLMQTLGDAATCSDCFTHSRAAHYPNSDEQGTESEISKL